MRSRRRTLPGVVRLEDRTVPANILQVEPIWISPPHVREFAPDGTFVGQITPPSGDPRDVVVSPNGDIHVFDGTFSPKLATYHPDTGTWTDRTTEGWSAVNNLSYGGIAAFADYVYVTDMQTAYETPPFNGIIRFNMADDTVERFAQGHNYIAMCLGLDGYLYAMGGQTGMGNDIDKYDPETMAHLGTFRAPLGDGRGVAVGTNGDYYVADWGNSINRFDAAGNFIRAQTGGNGAVDVSLDGQVISGNQLMDLELNIVGYVGDGNYHASFATPQIPLLAPILDGVEPTALTVTEGDPAATVSATIAITQGRSTTIAGATIAVAENFVAGEDVLSFDTIGNITGTYNPATGVLTLTGVASVADYQAALRTVRYEYTGDAPAPRRVTFRVDDGNTSLNLSNTVSRTVAVAAVNDAPTIGLPVVPPIGHAGEVVAINGIMVGDVDAGTGPVRLLLEAQQGQVTFADLSGVAIVGGMNGTSMVEIEGTVAAVNLLLRDGNLSFWVVPGNPGGVSLLLTVDDLGGTGTGGALTDTDSLVIQINPAVPHLNVGDSVPLTFAEGLAKKRVTPRMKLTAGSPTLTAATVAVTANYVPGEDELVLPERPKITDSFDPATGVLTLSGTATVKQYQSALRAVRYANASKNLTTAAREVSIRVTDGVSGNGWSAAVTRSVQPKPVNTAPVLTLPPKQTTAQNVAIAIDGIAAADVDSNGGVAKLTLRVDRGAINFVTLGTVTISEGANDSRMIAVAGTLAEINSLLAAGNLIYQPPTDWAGTATLRLTLNDLGGTGTGGPKQAAGSVRVRVL